MSSRLIQQIVIGELTELADRIAANIIKTEQADTGATRRSMHVERDGDTFTLYSRRGLYNLEIGTHHRPPHGVIKAWVTRKITQDPKEASNIAWAILSKHAAEGSFLRRHGRTFHGVPNPDVYSSEIKKTVQNLYSKLGAAIIREIQTIALNF